MSTMNMDSSIGIPDRSAVFSGPPSLSLASALVGDPVILALCDRKYLISRFVSLFLKVPNYRAREACPRSCRYFFLFRTLIHFYFLFYFLNSFYFNCLNKNVICIFPTPPSSFLLSPPLPSTLPIYSGNLVFFPCS